MAKNWIKPRAWYVAKIVSLSKRSERAHFLENQVPSHLQADVRREVERLFATRARVRSWAEQEHTECCHAGR